MGLPRWCRDKDSTCECRRHRETWVQSLCRIRSPGEGNGSPVQYFCLKNPIDRGVWWVTDWESPKSQTWLCERKHTHTQTRKHTHTQTHKHTHIHTHTGSIMINTQVSAPWIWKHASIQLCWNLFWRNKLFLFS